MLQALSVLHPYPSDLFVIFVHPRSQCALLAAFGSLSLRGLPSSCLSKKSQKFLGIYVLGSWMQPLANDGWARESPLPHRSGALYSTVSRASPLDSYPP